MIRVYRENDAPRGVTWYACSVKHFIICVSIVQQHGINKDSKICILVRKRPISTKEIKRSDYDCVTCANPIVVVHDCK